MATLTPPRRAVTTLLAVAAALTACGDDDDEAGPLPDVVLPALAGFDQEDDQLDPGGLDGPAVLNVWATWCVPCRTELPDFQRASDENPGVRFIGVDESFDSGSVDYLADLGVTYEQFVDADGAFAAGLRIVELPATVVIDGDGEIASRHSGPMSYDELVEVIEGVDGDRG